MKVKEFETLMAKRIAYSIFGDTITVSEKSTPVFKLHVQDGEILGGKDVKTGMQYGKEEWLGRMYLRLATNRQTAIAIQNGGWLGVKEADEDFNDASRGIISAMQTIYGNPLLGKFNIYDGRLSVVSGNESPFYTLPGPEAKIFNACADFVIPPVANATKEMTDQLAGLIRLWNAPTDIKAKLLEEELAWYGHKKDSNLVEDMHNLVEALGGCLLLWV